jgi:hypothetical protein
MKKKTSHVRKPTGPDLPFEEAERRAFARITFSQEEAGDVSTRIVQELKDSQLQPVQWATVRHLQPHPLWEGSFESDKELHKFRRSFKDYTLQDTPKQITLNDFLCMMRSKKDVDKDLTCFAKHLDYLQENDFSYLLTVQTVRAERDPRQLEHPPSLITKTIAVFGKRIHYILEEYCLVRDMVLTRHDRGTSVRTREATTQSPMTHRQLRTITIPSPILGAKAPPPPPQVASNSSNSRVVEESHSAHDGSRSVTVSY